MPGLRAEIRGFGLDDGRPAAHTAPRGSPTEPITASHSSREQSALLSTAINTNGSCPNGTNPPQIHSTFSKPILKEGLPAEVAVSGPEGPRGLQGHSTLVLQGHSFLLLEGRSACRTTQHWPWGGCSVCRATQLWSLSATVPAWLKGTGVVPTVRQVVEALK